MSETSITTALENAVAAAIPRYWKRAKRRADRDDRLRESDLDDLLYPRRHKLTLKDVAYEVMEQAYMKASNDGTLPANARQIMYAARPFVLETLDGKCWRHDAYFTQVLLPSFIEEHPEKTADWDVVYDARGHVQEPHTGSRTDLGTLEVRGYITGWDEKVEDNALRLEHRFPTAGPINRYDHVLFVEKEGFNALLEEVQLARRFDIALMSTKGMSVTAARELVEALSARGVRIFVLHDFDKAGLTILRTLRSDTRRYRFRTEPNVVDLGLRLEDVEVESLASEPVEYKGRTDPRNGLRECGATEDECDFLVREETGSGWTGERVELNAMTSRQLVDWLERKLQEHGVTKLVPGRDVLAQAYRRAHRLALIQQMIDSLDDAATREAGIPRDIKKQVEAAIADRPTSSWDEVVYEIAQAAARGRRRRV